MKSRLCQRSRRIRDYKLWLFEGRLLKLQATEPLDVLKTLKIFIRSNEKCLNSSTDPTHVVHGGDGVEAWYKEIEKHIFHKEPTTTGTGHFTQIVWKTSKELGVGMAKNRFVT